MIPMVDLKIQYEQLKEEIDAGIADVLENTQFIMGPNVKLFEEEAAEYLGVKHAIGCASGTDALQLALMAAGIGPGDEVITPAFTFIATAEAISAVGATPVFVDICPASFNMDIEAVESAITAATKAIMPVHLFGQPANLPLLRSLCKQLNLLLVEDAAQSFGAAVDDVKTMAWGDLGCTSFFPSKNLGCYGDGGMVTTQSDELAEQVRLYCNHGSKVRYHHDVIGVNSRLDEIQASILRTKLRHIDEFNLGRRRVAEYYRELLAGSPVITPFEDGIGTHVYHQYTTLVPADQRDHIMSHLQQQGIACAIYYPIPLHQQKAFADRPQPQLPVTEGIMTSCLSLPVFPEMTRDQVEAVAAAVLEAVKD